VIHPDHGLLVPPADPEALASAITCLAAHPERRADMGARARERFAAEFEVSGWAARLAAVYREVLAEEQ
ncbi:MAG: glycosyltransferase family 4 protein, partial [Gemmatimonadetes bacterium]|nr:glycosyltransferase family 4 protein [Gemmatimonadota bacterium]NIR39111.1 glycosyltransferase family 4 protein [Actinomycetota bacterium]NIX22881.1 hypothetical protein [Actinomycetota bacterium]